MRQTLGFLEVGEFFEPQLESFLSNVCHYFPSVLCVCSSAGVWCTSGFNPRSFSFLPLRAPFGSFTSLLKGLTDADDAKLYLTRLTANKRANKGLWTQNPDTNRAKVRTDRTGQKNQALEVKPAPPKPLYFRMTLYPGDRRTSKAFWLHPYPV